LSFYIRAGHVKAQKQWKVLFDSREDRERFYRLLQINMLTKPRSASAQARSYYVPRPLQFSRKVEATVRQLPIARLASQLHSVWCLHQQQKGWRYGKELDEKRMTHPLIVPYKELPPAHRDDTANVVTQTLASILALGFLINKQTDDGDLGKQKATIANELLQLIEFLAENTHDIWASKKMLQGWVYGATKERMAKTHPALRPYCELSNEDKDRTRNSAYKILGSLTEWGYTITKKEKDDDGLFSPTPTSPSSGNSGTTFVPPSPVSGTQTPPGSPGGQVLNATEGRASFLRNKHSFSQTSPGTKQ